MLLITTFTSGTTLALQFITTSVIVAGAAAAFWKFFLQQPLGNNYHVQLCDIALRPVAGNGVPNRVAYVVTLGVQNRSGAAHRVEKWWRRIVFPDDAPASYDPNGSIPIADDGQADCRFGAPSLRDYRLATGEQFVDQFSEFRESLVDGLCYVEWCLKYREWGRKRGCLPWRVPTYHSQIMIAPIKVDDFALFDRTVSSTYLREGRDRVKSDKSAKPNTTKGAPAKTQQGSGKERSGPPAKTRGNEPPAKKE